MVTRNFRFNFTTNPLELREIPKSVILCTTVRHKSPTPTSSLVLSTPRTGVCIAPHPHFIYYTDSHNSSLFVSSTLPQTVTFFPPSSSFVYNDFPP